MKKLFAFLMALAMTFQLVMPVWADAVEEQEETKATVEVDPEATEETELGTEETVEEPAEEPTEETSESIEVTEESVPEMPEESFPSEDVVDEVEDLETSIASGQCGKTVNWVLNENGLLTISGQGDMKHYDIDSDPAPWYYYRDKITALVISNGVTSIGSDAFRGCEKLKTTQVADSVTDLGNYVFRDCTELRTFHFPAGVKDTGRGTFYDCIGIQTVDLPDQVVKIGSKSFYNCTSLSEIELPDTVTTIYDCAFSNCYSLSKIHIPEHTATIDAMAFSRCTGLQSIRIPGSVRVIGSSAFYGCTGLMAAEFGEGVTETGEYVFSDCTSLNQVSIPNTVTAIGDGAFVNCTALEKITLPESLQSIGASAFSGCGGLVELDIPADVKQIGNDAFAGCASICEINIPIGVTKISGGMFSGCEKLKTVSIPQNVTTIGANAFHGCVNLAGLNMPEKVNSIGEYAFFQCRALKSIQIPSGVSEIAQWTFSWCESLVEVEIPESVTKIGYNGFFGCSQIQKIQLPNHLKEIGPWAFRECVNLKELQIPESVTELGEGAFGGCAALLQARIPAGITIIKDSLFAGCASLMSMEIPNGVTSIGEGAFRNCDSLVSLTIPESVTTIGRWAFMESDRLQLIDLSAIPDTIGNEEINLSELVTVPPMLEKTTGGQSKLEWSVQTVEGEIWGDMIGELIYNPDGTYSLKKWGVGKFYLVCRDLYTGATGRKIIETKSDVQISPEEVSALIEGQKLQLSVSSGEDGTPIAVKWSIPKDDSQYATITSSGLLTAKMVSRVTPITVVATLSNGETITKVIQILPKAKSVTIMLGNQEIGNTYNADMSVASEIMLTAHILPEGAITAVRWSSSNTSVADIDENGKVTLQKMGNAVITVATLDGSKLSAKVTLNVIPRQTRALRVVVKDPENLGSFSTEETGAAFCLDANVMRDKDRQFQLTVEAQYDGEKWASTKQVKYISSDTSIANVSADGILTVKKASSGECVIRIQSDDLAKVETQLRIIVEDKSPRLETTALTLNSNLTAGATTALVESYNNTIQSVTLYDYNKSTKGYESSPSKIFAAEAEDGTLTVRTIGAQASGTYQLKLTVDCLGGSYDFTLQVKVANSLPKVTVKQVGKFDTFYLDSTAQLTATAAGCQVERLELAGAETFRMDEDGNLFYADSDTPSGKINAKGTLRVYLEGYQVPVEKAVTIATTKTAPKLTLNPTASVINTALEEPACRVKVLWNGKALDLTDADVTPDVGFAAVEAQGEYLAFRLTGATGGTAKLSLRLPGWAQAVSLTHKITVETKLPTVKLGTPTLKLNRLFSAQTAQTSVWLTQGNLDIGTMDFVSAKPEGEKIALSFDPETDSIEAKFNEIPKAGTYSYTYTAYLEDRTALKTGTIKVTVAATAPKVKLSAASVKLNRYLAGQEKAEVKVTLTGGAGYRVTGFEGLPEYMSYDAEAGSLAVVLPDENFTGKSFDLYPIVRDEESGQEVKLPTKLTLKVQTINTNKLTVSLAAKGKLDTVNPDSAIAYTVTKVNNCLGTVDGVDLIGENADLFQADLDTTGTKPVVLLRLLPGETYATNKTYKVQFRFTICGAEVLSPVQSVKAAQTALKVTAPKTAVYYLAQSGPMRCSLNANLPLESVALSAKTAKEFQQALGGGENLRLVGNRLEFRLTNPSALKAGKSYSVQLELLPENAAENTKPTTVKLTVKVMK